MALQNTVIALAVMSVCLPVLYVLYVMRSAIQGMGNTILPLLSAMVEFMLRTLSALLLPRFIGETGCVLRRYSPGWARS